jgi:hypothetical protein
MLPDSPVCGNAEIFYPCAAAMYRRDAFEQVQGFDEDFFCYAEDVDLGFRLRLLGHRALYVPDAVVYHVGSGSTGRRSDFSVYHGQRNLVWSFVKNMPVSLLLLYWPAHVLMNIAALAILAFRGQGRVAWRAKIDAIHGCDDAGSGERSSPREDLVRELLAQMGRGWPQPTGGCSILLLVDIDRYVRARSGPGKETLRTLSAALARARDGRLADAGLTLVDNGRHEASSRLEELLRNEIPAPAW